MKRTRLYAIFLSVCFTLAAFAQTSVPKPPDTPKHPVTDEYFGVKVTDDYRWLENWDDPAVKQWSAAENARTREYLDHLPARPAIKERLKHLIAASSASYSDLQFRAGVLFAERYQPPQQQPTLVVMRSADDPASAKVIFDPNATGGGLLAVDFYVPSFGGKYVAAAMSEGGSEDSSAHIFEVATGKELSDVVPRVNFGTAGGSFAWKADSSGFYYTRYPQGNERPPEDANFYQQVYFHKLGTDPKQDTYVIGKDFPRIAEIKLLTSDDGRWLLASVANGDGGQFAHYVMDLDGHWTQITHFEDGIVSAKFGPGGERGGGEGALYLLSRKDAPRGQILRLSLAQPDLAQAKVIVPQSSGGADESDRSSIEDFIPTWGHLYVIDMMGGPSRVRVFDMQGRPLPAPSLPPVSSVDQTIAVGGGDVLFRISTYVAPPAYYYFDSASGQPRRTALLETSPAKFDDTEVVREFAVSKDGTRIPLNIIRLKKTRRDGANPVLLTGYGGFSLSSTPTFDGWIYGPGVRLWLDQGGIFAEANIRGGGEYGEEWHRQAIRAHRQVAFDDFIAAAEWLIAQHYTSSPHLAIYGRSNGGLLVGACLTQRPDLYGAVIAGVGVLDMLRFNRFGQGVGWEGDYGSPEDSEDFKALYAYSPLHNVHAGVYPATLIITGDHDTRVMPAHSFKFAATLQAAQAGAAPVLLDVELNSGHGGSETVSRAVAINADILAFLTRNLGMTDR